MAVFLIFLYLLFITPVRFGAALRLSGAGRAEGAAAVLVWGVRLQARFLTERDADGRLRLKNGRGKVYRLPAKKPGRGAMETLRTALRAELCRKLIRNGVRVTEISVDTEVGGTNAAFIALATAFLRALDALLPVVRVRARPAFHGPGTLNARCIVQARLGTLLTAGALGALSLARGGKKEETAWNIPSET